MKSLRVKDAVTSRKPPRCIAPDAPLADAWRALRDAGASDLVVTSDGTPDGRLIGVLPGRALLERGLADTADGVRLDPIRPASALTVETPQPATEESDLSTVLNTMFDLGVRALPLVHGGRLSGLITETDVLLVLENRLEKRPDLLERPGERVVEDVETGLANPLWANFMQLLSEAGI